MIEGKTPQDRSQDTLVRRGIALVASLLVVLWTGWLTIAAPANAGPTSQAQLGPPPTTTSSTTTTSTTTTTTRPRPTTTPVPTTQPPQTTETTETTDPPTTEDTEPDPPDGDDEEETTTSREVVAVGLSPIATTENLLINGNGVPGGESAQAPEEKKTKAGSSSDEDRVIWMIIAGLAAVALLVALLTWRYWLLTRPGIDLSDDDPDDGGFDGYDGGGGGGGYYGGDPAPPSADPYAAAAPRMGDVNPMTTGMPDRKSVV